MSSTRGKLAQTGKTPKTPSVKGARSKLTPPPPPAGPWENATPLREVLPEKEAKAFAKEFGYTTVGELLMHAPRAYVAQGQVHAAGMITEGEVITIIGEVVHTNQRTVTARHGKQSGRPMKLYEVTIFDGSAQFSATFFNAHWIPSMLPQGSRGMFTGKVKLFGRQVQLQHPDYLVFPSVDESTGKVTRAKGSSGLSHMANELPSEELANVLANLPYIPVYPAKKGMPSWRIFAAIYQVLQNTDTLPDPIGTHIPQGLPDFDTAVRQLHLAQEPGAFHAVQRLKYNEALTLNLVMALRRAQAQTRSAPILAVAAGAADGASSGVESAGGESRYGKLAAALPYALTAGQQRVLAEITADLSCEHPMQRLLQGEVGSGKTVVSVLAMLQAVDAGYQCALLAPTEVLAQQHGHSIRALLDQAGVQAKVTVLTGSLPVVAKRQALLDIVSGEAHIVVGTHALLQEGVEFFRLGFCVVDEQHRFGVEQRDHLRNMGPNGLTPHLLVMTATPIPRTIAITAFGDLTVSILSELPGGRKPIQTHVIQAGNTKWVQRMWERTREEIQQGRQAYVVCPRIQGEGGVEETKLQLQHGELKGLKVAMLHGGMHPEDKDAIMAQFAAGMIDVLVSTTVIEVGIDVPNATVMIITEPEQFGISQLHQLRGRVGRGGNASLCFLYTDRSVEEPSFSRLQAVAETNDGFALAELDLSVRQEGNVLGVSQSGVARTTRFLKLTQDRELVERAHQDADRLASQDPGLAAALVEGIELHLQEYLDKS
ncbi:ATP-dependent DNA helicase RecG [Corynebacterium kozikiae]|uniref:ATP-dependent DNA helicase RecG n=1 Tax=Corynebacterium kozikiae TaxID=2968469 RepID=UPI00211BDE11|nr:ATP-dependent DNA helicase RecG [Corynebacterium sp. 76QC2CO]MCQ9343435.1 ATP-dependent DNA helicase RecG [Corynebacterium sp. 76QC2CO]